MSETDPNTTENAENAEDEQLTDTAKLRFTWLSTLTAGALIGSMVLFTATLIYEPLPATWPGGAVGWLYLAAFSAAVTYAIGEDVSAIYQDLRGGTE